MSEIAENIRSVRENISEAALRAGRDPSAVKLMAVTKTVDDERILESIKSGIDIVGENYVQEARRKIEKMGLSVPWHLIGHLQTNKAKYAVKLFEMIHSVDRIELAGELQRRAVVNTRQAVLVQVNCSAEPQKGGVEPEALPELLDAMAQFDRLALRGLMTMAALTDDVRDQHRAFALLRELRDSGEQAGHRLPELSMGMSGDYAVAVEEGATIVRLGTVLFGERAYE